MQTESWNWWNCNASIFAMEGLLSWTMKISWKVVQFLVSSTEDLTEFHSENVAGSIWPDNTRDDKFVRASGKRVSLKELHILFTQRNCCSGYLILKLCCCLKHSTQGRFRITGFFAKRHSSWCWFLTFYTPVRIRTLDHDEVTLNIEAYWWAVFKYWTRATMGAKSKCRLSNIT
jgi:hypothetical protein